jgi:hypothetical protein
MKNIYLVTPQKSNSLVKEEIYKKGKLKLTILSTWKKCVILVDSIPKSKTIDGLKITEFKNIEFKANRYDFKNSLNLPDELSKNEKSKIKEILKDGFTWMLDREGWKSIKSVYKVRGEFNSINVPVHKLTLRTSQIELVHRSITSEEFEDYSKNGMPRSLFEDSILTSDPKFDELTSLYIDEVELPEFSKNFKIKYDQAVIDDNFKFPKIKTKAKKNEIDYAVIGESWIKRSCYDLIIYEEFDFSKLEILISRDYLFGKETCYETFSLQYNEIDFQFREHWGANSSDYALIDSNGNETELNLIDDDEEYEDEDEDEDN